MADTQTTTKKILPEKGKRNILITSALPYVNNVPHLGNVVGSVLSADVFSRYCKGRGYPTLFICGTDEYGTVTETKAIQENCTPQELCAKYRVFHAQTYEWFNIRFDHFGQTPTQQQTDITQAIFTKLNENGYLEERTTIQPYCEHHSSFLADRFIEGICPLCGYEDARGDQCDKCGKLVDALDLIQPRCKLDGATPVRKETRHIFILLDKLQPALEKWAAESSKHGVWSNNAIQITNNWFKEGLLGRSITRDLRWGTQVPLPGYEEKSIYAWFDACIGYISITANYTTEWEQWWRAPEDVQLYQFMGKDNVPFHSVMFPASLIGTGETWTKLHHLSATEYLNYEGGKFSKSRNIGVFGRDAEETGIPSDVWRYYLLLHRPESGDSMFEWKVFIDGNNNELLKNLGNFVNRIIKFVNAKNYESVVPNYTEYDGKDEFEKWNAEVDQTLKQYIAESEAVKIKAALLTAMRISALGNKLLQEQGLNNKLAEEQPSKCAAVVGLAINLVHLLATVFEPYLPTTSEAILRQLNLGAIQQTDVWNPTTVPAGHKINKAEYLFSQIDPKMEEVWQKRFGEESKKQQGDNKAASKAGKKSKKEPKQPKEPKSSKEPKDLKDSGTPEKVLEALQQTLDEVKLKT